MNTEIIFYAIILIALLPFLFYSLSARDIFFTRLGSGDIKFIMRGDSLIKMIHNVQGKKLVNGRFENGIESKSWLNEKIGIWWIGIPPWSSVHQFEIKKEKENPSGITPETWITVGEKVSVNNLRFTFPRPFVMRAVELKDRTTVDLLVVCKFEIEEPYIPVFLFKGGFFENAGSIIRAKVNDRLKKFGSIEEFIQTRKGEDGFLKNLKQEHGFNDILREQVGLKLVGIVIAQYDPADKAVLEATNKEAIAKLLGLAQVAEATAYANQLQIRTVADRDRLIELSKGREAIIQKTVERMKETEADADTIAFVVGQILKADSVAQSQITSWVEGGSNTLSTFPIR